MKLFLGICVLEAEHRTGKLMGGKFLRRLPANPLRGRIRRDQRRIFLLEPLKLAQELIEFVVGNNGLVEDVVAVFVLANLLSKLLDAVADFRHRGLLLQHLFANGAEFRARLPLGPLIGIRDALGDFK